MEFNKSVSNPLLIGAIELVRAENTPEHMKLLTDQMLQAKYMTPAVVTLIPSEGKENANAEETGKHVNMPLLAAPGGKQYFMAFTDMEELKKWKDDAEQQTVVMTFDEYASLLFQKDSQGNLSQAAGFVINPFGANLIVPREMVAKYLSTKMA